MAEVFLSYSREDKPLAELLAASLRDGGWSVWWDTEIVGGQRFDSVLEQELERARCIVVLWSRHSVESEWVRGEAAVGAERQRLVPVMIDDVRLPLQFRQRHSIDLVNWSGDVSAGGFVELTAAIRGLVEGEPTASTA